MSDSRRPETQTDDDAQADRPRRRRLPVRLGIAALVLAVPVGGLVWLFQDDLFHPFGDARACEGSEAELSGLLGPGGVPLPADASEVHYYTHRGEAHVSFLSSRMPEFLHRAGFVPEGISPLAQERRSKYGLGEGQTDLPPGMCGSGVRGPVASYGGGGPSGGVLVELSPYTDDRFRRPARAMVTYTTR